MFYFIPRCDYFPEELRKIADFYWLDFLVVPGRKNNFEGKLKKLIIEDISEENLVSLGLQEKRIGIISPSGEIQKFIVERGFPVSIVSDFQDNLYPSFKFYTLDDKFFQRGAKDVAISLLGKLIVRKYQGRYVVGKIVETEAYFGPGDPASRAYKGKKEYNRGMWLPGGHIFVYMVHANWMFNITTDGVEPEAILIRAVEPLVGIDIMRKNRVGRKTKELCNGPGKWSRAFRIEREHNEKKLGDDIFVADSPWKDFEICSSGRIGVREDLEEDMRFFICNSKFVSRALPTKGKK